MHIQANIIAAVTASGGVAASGLAVDAGWPAIIEKFGITAGLLAYFIVRDIHNQRRADSERKALVKRIQTLEDEHRDLLTGKLKEATDLMRSCQVNHNRPSR